MDRRRQVVLAARLGDGQHLVAAGAGGGAPGSRHVHRAVLALRRAPLGVREDVVYARSGWISREWVFVPVSRIQTVDKEQGWFERMLGLATVEIRTASHAGSSTIKGLDYAVAARPRRRARPRAEELRDDAT